MLLRRLSAAYAEPVADNTPPPTEDVKLLFSDGKDIANT